jgi:hypothetical protein
LIINFNALTLRERKTTKKYINMKDFHVEKRKVFDNDYLNVSIGDETQLADVQTAISTLKQVRKVNITANSQLELTVYPKKMYSIDTVEKEVKSFLQQYSPGKAADPKIEANLISGDISEKAYQQITSAIFKYGKNMEKTPSSYRSFGEEDFRNLFLPHLNSISTSTTTTGETFNKNGKTDILVQNTDGENLFIAECKLWKGESLLKEAIDQLLDRYVTWRDSKLAIIVFNKDMKDFSGLIEKAHSALKSHSKYKRTEQVNDNTNQIFIFKHPQDESKEVKVSLLLFNYYAN